MVDKWVQVKLATYEANVKSGRWVPLSPRKPDQWTVIVRVPQATRGVRNYAGHLINVEICG